MALALSLALDALALALASDVLALGVRPRARPGRGQDEGRKFNTILVEIISEIDKHNLFFKPNILQIALAYSMPTYI